LDSFKVVRFSYSSGDPNRPYEVRTHTYYQWVSLVLVLQCFSFLIPNFIWKTFEDGKIESLAQKNLQTPVPDKEEKAKELDKIVDYWKNHRGLHTKFALVYFACELLNLVTYFLVICFDLGVIIAFKIENLLHLTQ
jgi:hypothetical protein